MAPSILGRDRRRWTVGLAVSDDCRFITGAAIAAHGLGLETRADVEASARTKISPHTRRLFRQLTGQRPRRPASLLGVLASELADAQAACVYKLARRAPAAQCDSLCLAVADPGLWREETPDERSCLGLCDGARLAELTGMNVLDAFSARDLAQGGRGGPLLAAPYWLLLRNASRPRVIVRLGAATEITLLPASRDEAAIDQIRVVSLDIGRALLAALARRLPERESTGQSVAALLALGVRRRELIDAWNAKLAIGPASADVWRPPGPPPPEHVDALLQSIVDNRVSSADALRTLLRWMAETIAERLLALGPIATGSTAPTTEVVLAGRGSQHEPLRADLAELLPAARFLTDGESGFPVAALDAAATAWWGQLYLDQTPGNLPSLTGAKAPRVLGRFTPGSPQNFLRFVRAMASQQPVVSLRTAI